MTRAMLWTVLARLDGQNLAGDGSWYEKAQQWTVNKGLSDGSNPNESITREQLVTKLWRYASSPKPAGDLSRFSDADHVADYAKQAIAWATEKGLIQGDGGKLMPQGNATKSAVGGHPPALLPELTNEQGGGDKGSVQIVAEPIFRLLLSEL